MSIELLDQPESSVQVHVEMELRGLMLATDKIDKYRRSNEGRQVVIDNVLDLELTRDRLSRILDDVRRPS